MPPDTQGPEDRAPVPARHRPLVPVLAGLALGIAVDSGLRPPPAFWWVLLPAGAALCAWGLARGLKPWGLWVLAFALMAFVGGLRHADGFRQVPAWHLQRLALDGSALYHFRGRVRAEPVRRQRRRPFAPADAPPETYWLVKIETEALSGDGETWRPTEGGLTVFVDAGRPSISTGQRVAFTCRPYANRPPTNPGQRDAALQYARTGSHATASVGSPSAFNVIGSARWRDVPAALIGSARSRLAEALQSRLGPDNRPGLAMALLLGRRDALTPEQQGLLRESGTMHFLAISGLHVGLFCVFVGSALALLGLAPGARSVLTVVLIWCYVLLTGSPVSAVRAAWMLTFLLMAPVLKRRGDPLSALAGAAVLILLLDPQALFSPGFQLSFTAVWALSCIYPQMAVIVWPWQDVVGQLQDRAERTVLRDVWLWARSYLLLCVVVWAATAPIRLYYFNSLCLFGPLLNLLIWPLVLLLLISSFALALCLALLPWAADPMVRLVGFFGGNIEAVLRPASKVPGFGIYMPSPPAWWVLAFCCVLALWGLRRRLRHGKTVFVTAAALLAGAYVVEDAAARLGRTFTLTVTDVGAGQAVVAQTPEGHAVLFDAGSMRQGAQQAVAEVLWHRRIGLVGAAALSHLNADHCSFLPFLAGRFDFGAVAVPSAGELPAYQRYIRDVLRESGLDLRALREGGRLRGGDLRCTILHPNPRFAADPSLAENERSLVVRGEYRGLTFLLTGDVEDQAMRRLCRDYGRRLAADVLVMPHHGHYHAGLAEFVAFVAPSVAVVSGREVDCDPRTADLLARRGTPAWITGREGAIIVSLHEGRARVTGWASGRVREFEVDGSAVSRHPDEGTEEIDAGSRGPQGR